MASPKDVRAEALSIVENLSVGENSKCDASSSNALKMGSLSGLLVISVVLQPQDGVFFEDGMSVPH